MPERWYTDGYTLAQAARVKRVVWPKKGPRCPDCNERVPRLYELTDAQADQLRRLEEAADVRAGAQTFAAMTGVQLRWALTWARHGRNLQLRRCDVRPVPWEEAKRMRYEDVREHARGRVCRDCDNSVPEVELPPDLMVQLENRTGLWAIHVFRTAGLDETLAKVWALHHPLHPQREPGPPCPYCGAELLSERTRQCSECKADWHERNGAS